MAIVDSDKIADPHKKLAKLIETVTGLSVEPDAVRKLVARHWRQVQSLAHQIREDDIEHRTIEEFKRRHLGLVPRDRPATTNQGQAE